MDEDVAWICMVINGINYEKIGWLSVQISTSFLFKKIESGSKWVLVGLLVIIMMIINN